MVTGRTYPLKGCHHRPAEPARAPIGANRDPLHIPGAQRPTLVDQSPLHHRGMPGQVEVVPHQRVNATEGVLPIVIGHVIEHVVEKPADCTKRGHIKIGGVGKAYLGHLSILARQVALGDHFADDVPD